MATTASVYNASRTTRQVLKRHRKEGPSLTLHLHANTFRFERQVSGWKRERVRIAVSCSGLATWLWAFRMAPFCVRAR